MAKTKFSIGDVVQVKGLTACGKVSFIRHGDLGSDKENKKYGYPKYRVRESTDVYKYWSEKSLKKVRKCK